MEAPTSNRNRPRALGSTPGRFMENDDPPVTSAKKEAGRRKTKEPTLSSDSVGFMAEVSAHREHPFL